jgi:hypothetical protein
MQTDYSLFIGPDGTIARSGKTIYDLLHEGPVRLDENSRVTGVRVVAGEILAELDTTGTLTKKYQAKSREPVTASHLISQSDSYPRLSFQPLYAAQPRQPPPPRRAAPLFSQPQLAY